VTIAEAFGFYFYFSAVVFLKPFFFLNLFRRRQGGFDSSDPCSPSPCGSNTNCRVSGSRAVCSCQYGYYGNPETGCIKGDCLGESPPPRQISIQINFMLLLIVRSILRQLRLTCTCIYNGAVCLDTTYRLSGYL
jgi:hypothetical protein